MGAVLCTTAVLALAVFLISYHTSLPSAPVPVSEESHFRKLLKDETFGKVSGSVQGTVIRTECWHNSLPMCCNVLNETPEVISKNLSRHLTHKHHHRAGHLHHSLQEQVVKCQLKRTYVPSTYEVNQRNKAAELDEIEDFDVKKQQYVDFITSDDEVGLAMKWLELVKVHMNSELIPATDPSSEDASILSHFLVTRECFKDDAIQPIITEWREWIEPLSVHARHPLAQGNCKKSSHYDQLSSRLGTSVSVGSVDHIIVQSIQGLNLIHSHQINDGDSNNMESSAVDQDTGGGSIDVQTMSSIADTDSAVVSTSKRSHRKHFMFDAGASTFQSSMWWFVCAFAQRGIRFDQIYGWEITILEPNLFWSWIPDTIKPIYHFLNIPVQPRSSDPNSPLRMIMAVAGPDDFVAFKLDIDTPTVEIPIVMELLHGGGDGVNVNLTSGLEGGSETARESVAEGDVESAGAEAEAGAGRGYARLVDEFFFELHFQCEVMRDCGWGTEIPDSLMGLKLDRTHALELFASLREKGIRAHIWP